MTDISLLGITAETALMKALELLDYIKAPISAGFGEDISARISDRLLSAYGMEGSVTEGMPVTCHSSDTVRAEKKSAGGGYVVQNIYLRDREYSPYLTARRIRRESETAFKRR